MKYRKERKLRQATHNNRSTTEESSSRVSSPISKSQTASPQNSRNEGTKRKMETIKQAPSAQPQTKAPYHRKEHTLFVTCGSTKTINISAKYISSALTKTYSGAFEIIRKKS
ncbi:hypothetical protein ACJMK2_030905 [Sinanodonta woodiana]|uniref:Uncharacterized protein n=1 Tax=Sinanodonta woodiana TaxID=1069815 RepID=A0ABD3WZ78_SINWO